MPTITITTRTTKKSGKRFVVRYRLGGRAYPIVSAGSFRTLKEARARRDFVAGELAVGRNPAETLRAVLAAPRPTLTLSTWRDRFLASRIDVDENTRKNYISALKKACERFGDRAPAELQADDVAAWIAELSETLKPSTIRLYVISLRLLLDYAGTEPNVARDPRVKLPKRVREEPKPRRPIIGRRSSRRWAPSGGCSSSRSSRVRYGSARRPG